MQTSCPKCQNRLVLDDAKIPDTPFMVKCPKCQNTMKLPGKKTAPEAAPSTPPPSPPPAVPTPPPAPEAPASAAPPPAPPTPPHAVPTTSLAKVDLPGGQALVSLANAEQANFIAAIFGKLGYETDQLDGTSDQFQLRLQSGEYSLVAASPSGLPEERDLFLMVRRQSPDIRRRLFVVLIGEELTTGEGTQAYTLTADLVLNPSDVSNCERILVQTILERRRLYQTFWDAEDRKAEGRL